MSIEQCFYLSEICYESNYWISNILKKNFKTDDILINNIRNYLLKDKCKINIKQKLDIGLPNIGICETDENLIISFSGLSNKLDILTCLNYLLIFDTDLNCYIHNGFNNILKSIIDEVQLIIDIKNKKNIIFTGHSLGAAIAKLCCLYINKLKLKNYSCITFACPLIGNQSFADQFNIYVKDSYNFLCQNDFVINIPLFRECNHNNCFMIKTDEIVPYKVKTFRYLINLLKLNVDTHRLRYLYRKIILDKPNLGMVLNKFNSKNN
jgi:hypothetical protein